MSGWSYDIAFSRNRGLVDEQEQERLRGSRVAIAGMGGVGGIHLITLTRLGIGKFTISDPDTFSVANTNRQYGAKSSTVGRNKAEVMAEIAQDINPELDIRIVPGGVTKGNMDVFLEGVDVFVDALDVFSIDTRRAVYSAAAERGMWAVSAGPFGFSTGWMTFAPDGMSFDTYFDLRDDMSEADMFVAFIAGVAPGATHLKYLDKSKVDFKERTGPSVGVACDLAAGVLGVETVKILLQRGGVKTAPQYQQFDPYLGVFKQGRAWFGNRNPVQRLKRWYLMQYAKKHDMLPG